MRKASEIYEIVYNAHTRAVEAAKAGVPASFVDRTARQVIESRGMASSSFIAPGTASGWTIMKPQTSRTATTLRSQPGNCFSVEPGIYLEGSFGVRLENIVAIAGRGHEVLNEAIPPQLMDVREVAGQ